jgi:hypothetical protein
MTRSASDVKQEFTVLKQRKAEMERLLGSHSKIKSEYKKLSAELKEKVEEYAPLHRCFIVSAESNVVLEGLVVFTICFCEFMKAMRDVIKLQFKFLFEKRSLMSNGLCLTFTALSAQRGYKVRSSASFSVTG